MIESKPQLQGVPVRYSLPLLSCDEFLEQPSKAGLLPNGYPCVVVNGKLTARNYLVYFGKARRAAGG